ncbi:hypothetical protein TNCV_290961 [Trichonephila clavipes]|nr:hypothetical protein TNCV_290961 [Trichonephila clavipes]
MFDKENAVIFLCKEDHGVLRTVFDNPCGKHSRKPKTIERKSSRENAIDSEKNMQQRSKINPSIWHEIAADMYTDKPKHEKQRKFVIS